MIPRRQGAAAEYGGKVPLPGAHANAPPGGVRATNTGEHWSVSKAIYYIRPNNHLCGT